MALIAMAVSLLACGSSAVTTKTALDVRGSWAMVAVADAVQYPQTMHITSEDLSTGKLGGTDFGSGQTFTVTGAISGADTTFTTTGGGYTSNSKATVAGSGVALTMAGTFTDSNHRSGTFTATRTAAGGSS